MSIISHPSTPLLSVQAEPPDLRIPRVDSSDLGVYAYLKRLIPSVPSHGHLNSVKCWVSTRSMDPDTEHRLTSAASPPYPNPFREPLVLKRHMLWSEPKLFMELKLADCYKLEPLFFLRSIMSVYSLPLRLSAKGSPSPKP
ncbi:unnamed protein product [Brassica rapa subsp. trilocularis]